MASKTFCPIMTIGFAPPEEGKRDLRLCMRDCAWYDCADETCKVNKIAENLEYIMAAIEGLGEPEYEPEKPIGFDETWADIYSRFK